ncbi:hypothetical protein NMG60_11022111 [Bertholletia excelsa]
MANNHELSFFFKLVLTVASLHLAIAGDPDIISDFIVPPNGTLDGNFFTFTGMRSLVGAEFPTTFKAIKVSMAEFPALIGQSVSYAVLLYPSGTVSPPHTHPRAAELLFLLEGSLEVGFVDTKNTLFTQTLETGDMFVFPKGLVHYQYNSDKKNPAVALSAFGSANAGIVSIPTTVFNTSIFDGVLAKSFKTGVATIRKLKAGLAH